MGKPGIAVKAVAWSVSSSFSKIASEHSSTLTKQTDGSVRAEGTRPRKRDTYTLTRESSKPRPITGGAARTASRRHAAAQGPRAGQ